MPKIRQEKLPPALIAHLLKRVQERGISAGQLRLFLQWVEREPEVPLGRWFRRFPAFIVCGEGELVKTFLREGQVPDGVEVP